MALGFTLLLAKIVALAVWLGELAVAVFVALWDFIRDAVCWPFEQMLKIAVEAVNALPLDSLTQNLTGWGSLPADLLNVLGLLGVGPAIAIIVAAIGIRLVLQLIPFTRLGS